RTPQSFPPRRSSDLDARQRPLHDVILGVREPVAGRVRAGEPSIGSRASEGSSATATRGLEPRVVARSPRVSRENRRHPKLNKARSEEHTSELQSPYD